MSRKQTILAILMAIAGLTVVIFKLLVVHVGAPYVTVDDNTMYEGGFLVWFGQAPPQRMYLESWVAGLASLGTYAASAASLGGNFVADAWRAFHDDPDPFVHTYRWLMLLVDLATVLVVYGIGRHVFRPLADGRIAALLVALMYLASFNTLWSNVVARPDTLTAFLAALGLFFYVRCGHGERAAAFYASAVAFGLAAGMKLHAAFFTVVVVVDLVRVLGLRQGASTAIPFGMVSVITFCVAAGSPLFDPLLYVKLRYLNAIDDASPWISWGEQFHVVLYGSAWLVAPLALYGAFRAMRSGEWRRQPVVASVFVLAISWLVLFCLIRQLRSYWMLPALPALYLAAVWTLWTMPREWVRNAIAGVLVVVLLAQSYTQMRELRSTGYGELRAWINANVAPDEPIYLLGYSGIGLPYSSVAIGNRRQGIERKMRDRIASGEPFTQRHVRLWEERADLRLFDMLDFRSGTGHTWYGYHDVPLDEYQGIVAPEDFRYVVVQQHFPMEDEPDLMQMLQQSFTEVARMTGPGGHSNGLEYIVYARR
jgi:hypothetical protein